MNGKTTTDRIKFNPQLGRMLMLQFVLPGELQVDSAYQRSIETSDSQALIRKIAMHWDWDLCQPLVVSRRSDGTLFVIDGQHRLAAARLRGDIQQLPAMVKEYASAADEAATFVQMNAQRRPLSPLQVFHAAVASGDTEACAIVAAIEAAGLRLGRTTNLEQSPPGSINNVGGLQKAWRRAGPKATAEALQVLAAAFAGERMIYAGSIFPGIVAVCQDEMLGGQSFAPARFAMLTAALGKAGQQALRKAILEAKAAAPNLNYGSAAAQAVRSLWRGAGGAAGADPAPQSAIRPSDSQRASVSVQAVTLARPAPAPARVAAPGPFNLEGGRGWCSQCEMRRTRDQAAACSSAFCKLKAVAA